jgi:protein TonB
MNTLDMDYSFEPRDPSRRFKGLVIVIALHVVIGYLLVTGLAVKGLNFIKPPPTTVVIQEVIIPPPPPPPPPPKKIEKMQEMPKVEAPPPPFVPKAEVTPPVTSNALVIESAPTPPTTPAVIAPPPPPAPPNAVIGPKRTSIGLACPKQVEPEMPARAKRDGTEGTVRAQIHVKNGVIVEVSILSGDRVFHAAVKAAMMQYKCVTDDSDVIATQDFTFKLE